MTRAQTTASLNAIVGTACDAVTRQSPSAALNILSCYESNKPYHTDRQTDIRRHTDTSPQTDHSRLVDHTYTVEPIARSEISIRHAKVRQLPQRATICLTAESHWAPCTIIIHYDMHGIHVVYWFTLSTILCPGRLLAAE